MESSGRIRSPERGGFGGGRRRRRLLPGPGQGSGPGIPKGCPVLRRLPASGGTGREEQPTLKKRKKEGETGGKRRKKRNKKKDKKRGKSFCATLRGWDPGNSNNYHVIGG